MVEGILDKAIRSRVFPGAVIEVGRTNGPLTTIARGAQTYAASATRVDGHTIYDLASLTKVLATASLMVSEVATGRMRLNDRVRHWIGAWTGEDRQIVTVQDLLEHASGLPGHRSYYQSRRGRASFELAICEEPLAYPPRTQSIYSDPGFMLLGFAMENAAGAPLDAQFNTWRDRELGADIELGFNPGAGWFNRIAPTEDTPDGEERRGEVHDENTASLGGVAAHAGLFGTAAAVGACARWWMRSPALAQFATKSRVPGSSRALAWDTMLPTSSCGTRLSASAIGHTGFTGTSLWIDPAKDLYIAMLSNRVHPTRNNEGITGVRRALHDAIVIALEGADPAGAAAAAASSD
ncbi:MAG TPA: serine hydrolase [Vicinamibacterales bacterium]|nr:serine hydrolase [Vicinamibacterales bacterium]